MDYFGQRTLLLASLGVGTRLESPESLDGVGDTGDGVQLFACWSWLSVAGKVSVGSTSGGPLVDACGVALAMAGLWMLETEHSGTLTNCCLKGMDSVPESQDHSNA